MQTLDNTAIEWRLLTILVAAMLVAACTKTALRSASPDGGGQDLASIPDVATKDSVLEKDLLPDLPNTTPDSAADLPPSQDSARDTWAVADTSVPIEVPSDLRDTLPVADTSVPFEAQSDLGDTQPVADTSVPFEAQSDLGDTQPVADTTAHLDVQGDIATPSDTSRLPPNITIFPNQDLPKADNQCIAATQGWVDIVVNTLTDAQKCAIDLDCSQAGFADKCGQVCLLAINIMKSGSFSSNLQAYADANCTSCPQPQPPGTMNPGCRSSGISYCHAGRCEFR